jgi:hypothetical protein
MREDGSSVCTRSRTRYATETLTLHLFASLCRGGFVASGTCVVDSVFGAPPPRCCSKGGGVRGEACFRTAGGGRVRTCGCDSRAWSHTGFVGASCHGSARVQIFEFSVRGGCLWLGSTVR